jgi:nucleoprotein TPR
MHPPFLPPVILYRNEVQRWSTRTNQLIEQYNKIDPDEYKKLV